ncbi:MAG: metallophosphoesterase [Clostridia bacterium]|nr:metallophosphoesterase [Clostridia bacterium]
MAVFVIADLHLDTVTNEKSMEIFGNRWQSYIEKLHKNWTRVVSDDDTVIIPGDISWALTTEDALADLKWIDALPGKKIIMKGNHDFWWSTLSKMRRFFCENCINSIDILYNNALEVENYIVAGSRGWFVDKSVQPSKSVSADYDKIVNREVIRLKLSLDEAKKLSEGTGKEIIAFFHFPPVWSDFECIEILETLKEYNVSRCYFGHIHGCYAQGGVFKWENIEFRMISADFLDFLPQIIG